MDWKPVCVCVFKTIVTGIKMFSYSEQIGHSEAQIISSSVCLYSRKSPNLSDYLPLTHPKRTGRVLRKASSVKILGVAPEHEPRCEADSWRLSHGQNKHFHWGNKPTRAAIRSWNRRYFGKWAAQLNKQGRDYERRVKISEAALYDGP